MILVKNGVVGCVDFVGWPFSSFVFVSVRIPSGVMRINIPNNKRHFDVAEKVCNLCVVTGAAAATWRNVDVVVHPLRIGHRNRNALLLQMRIR